MSHSRVFATAWVLLVAALVTEDLVAVVAGHLIHTPPLAVGAGAAAALPTRMLLGVGRHQHGVPRKHPIRMPREEEHRSIRVPKPQIRTRRKVGEHQAGVHLLGHRTPMLLLQTRAVVPVPEQDGGVQHPLGEGRRQNRPLGTRVRPRRRLTMGGPVQHHRRRGVGARRAG